jgi:hypothetical protein
MRVKATNKVGTEIYYLGYFVMEVLGRDTVPDLDTGQDKYIKYIAIRSENGHRVINSRQRASSNKRQDPSASKNNNVTPSAKKKARTDLKLPLSSSDEESSQSLTESSSKDNEVPATDDKSSSDSESERSEKSLSSTNQEKQAASRTTSPLAFG